MNTMGFKQIRHTAVGLGLLLALPLLAQPEAGVFWNVTPNSDRPDRIFERLLSQPGSDSAILEGESNDKRTPQKDTIRRYRDSGRVLILGGPEALSM
jgi:hypothetical protein